MVKDENGSKKRGRGRPRKASLSFQTLDEVLKNDKKTVYDLSLDENDEIQTSKINGTKSKNEKNQFLKEFFVNSKPDMNLNDEVRSLENSDITLLGSPNQNLMDNISALKELNEEILEIDKKVRNLEKRLDYNRKEALKWQNERTRIRELMAMNQDVVYKCELKIFAVDTEPRSRSSVIPNIFKSNEIALNKMIAASEVQKRQRDQFLITVNANLGNLLLEIIRDQELKDTFTETAQEVRHYRGDLGKAIREFRESIINKEIEFSNNSILRNFVDTCRDIDNKIKDRVAKCIRLVNSTNETTTEIRQNIKDQQETALISSDPRKLDETISSLLRKSKK